MSIFNRAKVTVCNAASVVVASATDNVVYNGCEDIWSFNSRNRKHIQDMNAAIERRRIREEEEKAERHAAVIEQHNARLVTIIERTKQGESEYAAKSRALNEKYTARAEELARISKLIESADELGLDKVVLIQRMINLCK